MKYTSAIVQCPAQ